MQFPLYQGFTSQSRSFKCTVWKMSPWLATEEREEKNLKRRKYCQKVRSKSLGNSLGFATASLAEGTGAGTPHQSCFCFCKADSKRSQRWSFLENHKRPLSFLFSQISPAMEV
uniref:Uncharacterized protein n=1 Tax=Mus spicilegus TaxID=10103 RepID=A0A8C6H5G0_MUSSI